MSKRTRILAAAAGVSVLGTVLAVTLLRNRAPEGIFASGTVEVTEADLGFQLPGRIDSIAVHEGDSVTAGRELAWLDRDELVARRRAAEGQRAAAGARLAELERGFRSEEIAQAREAARAAAERLGEARREADRIRRLFDGGAVSRRQMEMATTALEVADAQHQGAQEQLALLETGPRAEQIAAQRALVAQADAAISQADAALANAVVRAPFDGQVTVRHREPARDRPAGGHHRRCVSRPHVPGRDRLHRE
jgi:HlyD family secretion protein